MKYNMIRHQFSEKFGSLGKLIAKYPVYFIIVPLLLAGILATGLQRLKLIKKLDSLYTADESDSMKNRELIEQLFPMDYSKNFDAERITRMDNFAMLLITMKDDSSVLRKDIFNKIQHLDKMIRNITVEWNGEFYKYEDICAKKNTKCYKNEYLSLSKRISALENGTDLIKYPLYINTWTYDYAYYASNFGGVTTDNNGNLIDAKCIRLLYFLDSNNARKDQLSELWENSYVETLHKVEIDDINIHYIAANSLENEIHRTTIELRPLYSIAVFIMLVFSILTTLSNDWVESKPWCSVVGCLSSGIAVGASFGFLGYCGMNYIDINIAVPFLMLGIGMDDTFVLLAAWRCTDKKSSVGDRMAKSYENAAISITVTSLTNFISFLIGLSTPFPVVRIFSGAAASAIFFTYIFQITFFGGCLALFGYAEEKKLHSVTFLPIKNNSESEERHVFYRFLCTTRSNNNETSDEKSDFFMMTYFRDHLGKLLSINYIKFLILLVFCLYLIVAIWSCTKIKEGLEFQKLAPYNSFLVKAFDTTNKYFNTYRDRIQVIINIPLDYSNPEIQDQIEQLMQKFESNRYISSDTDLTESWLRYYKRFINDKRARPILDSYNMTNKEEFILCLRKAFLKFSAGKIVGHDLIFNENYTEILASRFILQSVNVSGVQDDKQMLIELKNIAKTAPFPVIVHHYLFVFYDQFLMVTSASFQSIGIAAIVMMVITFIFIPGITSVLSVAASIISIEIGVIGYMTLWNVNLDTVSMINLIMCIGFSVDFAAHISHAYKHTNVKSTPDERMRSSLYLVGLPIVQGSFSTILAILVLVAAPAYIFLVFFKVIVLVICFAALHALFLLPILFSIFGSITWNKKNSNKSKTGQKQSQKKTSIIRKISNTSIPPCYNILNKTETTDEVKHSDYVSAMKLEHSAAINHCYIDDL